MRFWGGGKLKEFHKNFNSKLYYISIVTVIILMLRDC